MITTIALYIALCSSPTTCDNYVPATWTASSQEERKFIMSMPVQEAYNAYMTSFKAEHMDGEVVDWEINCVKG